MAGEKYIVATAENPVHIAVRNILNPNGFIFLANCSDPASLMRMVRTYNPDFIVVDTSMRYGETRAVIDTIDDEMLCACIVAGEQKDKDLTNLIERSKAVSFCPKPLNRDMLVQIVEMSIINYRRINELNKKLREVSQNLETRKAVDRAKWILMQRHGISEDEAYERMRRKSMDSRTSIKVIAEAVILTRDFSKKD